MNEKTLLYGALTATALAAGFAVLRGHEPAKHTEIAPVSLLDSNRTVAKTEIPIQLTSSDGTGLRLASLEAATAIEDPLALTELHLVFENPEDRVLEGTFHVTLPQGASLSRFAMKVAGSWQEGEVVEKQAARRAYEDFLHRRQDPALMEQAGGNEFTARVFPIPARGKKEIVLAYSEVLEAGAPYVLPLRGLPELGALDVDVRASAKSDGAFALHQRNVTPAGDFVVEAKNVPRSAGLRSGDIAMTRVVPFASSRPEPISSAIVLVDTSASRALGLVEQAHLVQRVLAKLSPDTKVTVACFDQEVAPIYEGTAAGFGEREISAILSRGALGASDIEAALAWAGDQAKKANANRVVIVGDGVATAGETDGQKLKSKVESLRSKGVARVDAIAVGGIRDDAFLRGIVRGVLDRDGVVLDAKLGPDGLARRLSEATSSGVPVKVDGATWSWPKTLDGLQAGDEVIVYAQIDPAKAIRVTIGTQEVAPDVRTVERPLLERAWAQAKIASLVDAPTEDPVTTKNQIVALSTRHRVLSPHTAMLVLETDQDYRRFGIDRTANADILSVRGGHVAVVQADRGFIDRKQRMHDVTTGGEVANAPRANAAGGAKGDRAERAEPADGRPQLAQAVPAASAPPWSDEAMANLRTQPADVTATPLPPGALTPIPATPPAEHDLDKREAKKERPSNAAAGGAPPAAAAPPPSPRPPSRPSPSPTQSPPRAGRAAGVDHGDPFGASDADAELGRARSGPGMNPPTGDVRQGALTVQRGISQDEAHVVVRRGLPQVRACYIRLLASDPTLRGNVAVEVTIDRQGNASRAVPTQTSGNASLDSCATSMIRGMHFPAPGTAEAQFSTSFEFVPREGAAVATDAANEPASPKAPDAMPYDGRFKLVMDSLARGAKDEAFEEAKKWRLEQPGDVMSLVALGESLEAKGDLRTAARAYGSILELFASRADSRRFAGERLERLKEPFALRLAADTYAKAVEQRPDHTASHRLYAFALLKLGEHEKAFEAMRQGATRSYPSGRFLGVDRILREDLGLVAAAWTRAEPRRAAEIEAKLRAAGGSPEHDPSVRFVLVWETDANDVDFHVYDGRGGHAYYGSRDLPSGGSLYADVTTGYGPECFTIRGAPERRAYPYVLQAHYYSRGPMGYGMGKLELIEHDGKGGRTIDERPFVVMRDRAYVDLGRLEREKTDRAKGTALLK